MYRHEMEAVCRYLEGEAAAGRTVEYSRIFERVSGTGRFNIGGILGAISTDSLHERQVMLSAIVILHDQQRPSDGFFTCARGLGLTFSDQEEFWIEQVRQVFLAYQR